MPHSRVLSFAPGSRAVRVRCYMHTGEYRAAGWYGAGEREISLTKPFSWAP